MSTMSELHFAIKCLYERHEHRECAHPAPQLTPDQHDLLLAFLRHIAPDGTDSTPPQIVALHGAILHMYEGVPLTAVQGNEVYGLLVAGQDAGPLLN